MQEIESNKMFGGWQKRYQHRSRVLNCDMNFSIYFPPQAENNAVPVLYWLSGLTCNDQNFVTKAGAQRYAAEYGVAIVAPDTSPRGDQVPNDEAWDFGQGAGFYLNATNAPWSKHYHMYDYITEELPAVLDQFDSLNNRRKGIFGHSMGGHGALTIALKSGQFESVSAFSPICAPTQCPWGIKAFAHYLGSDQEKWKEYDACELLAEARSQLPILIDQGDADEFLHEQLKPEHFQTACDTFGHPLTLRMQPGYDHSYYFIASFIGEHIQYHAETLNSQ